MGGRNSLAALLLTGALVIGCASRNSKPPEQTFLGSFNSQESTPAGSFNETSKLQKPTFIDHFNEACGLNYILEEGDNNYWKTPEETLRDGGGDCEDMSLYLMDLIRDERPSARIILGYLDLRDKTTAHAWIELKIEGDVYVVDPTMKRVIKREKLSHYDYAGMLNNNTIRVNKIRDYKKRVGIEYQLTRDYD